MRAALAAGSVALLVVGGAAARVATAPSPLTDLRVVKVDLNAASVYEMRARTATTIPMRKHYIQQASSALQSALPAVKDLTPPSELVSAAKQLGATNNMTSVADAVKAILAHWSKQEPLPPKSQFIQHALDATYAELRSRFCTQVTDYRGAVTSNGVELSPPQFTWHLSCPYTIRGAEFEIPGHTWRSVDAGGDAMTPLYGGRVLQVVGNGTTTMTLTTDDETNIAPGVESDVIVIHGDSGTFDREGK